MSPRDSWPGEPTTQRAIRETIADARHEWQNAESVSTKCVATLRFGASLTRATVGGSWRDLRRPSNVWLPVGWVAISILAALVLQGSWVDSGQSVRSISVRSLNDLIGAFVITSPLTLFALALFGRRGSRLPVIGMATLVTGVMAVLLTAVVPFTMVMAYPSAFVGRTYSFMPVSLLLQWLLVPSFFAIAGLLLADRVINHARRSFMTSMALILPVLAIIIEQVIRFEYRPYNHLFGLSVVLELLLVAAATILLLWAELSRQAMQVDI